MATAKYSYRNTESLTAIAKKFNTSVFALTILNKWLIDPVDGHTCMYPGKITYNHNKVNTITFIEEPSVTVNGVVANFVELTQDNVNKAVIPNTIKFYVNGKTLVDKGTGKFEFVDPNGSMLVTMGTVYNNSKLFALVDYSFGTIYLQDLDYLDSNIAMEYDIDYGIRNFLVVPLIGNGNTSIEDYWHEVTNSTGISFDALSDYLSYDENNRESNRFNYSSTISDSSVRLANGLYQEYDLHRFSEDYITTYDNVDANDYQLSNIIQNTIDLGATNRKLKLYREYMSAHSTSNINTLNYDIFHNVNGLYAESRSVSKLTNLSTAPDSEASRLGNGIVRYNTVGSISNKHGIKSDVQIVVGNTTINMPCYPDSISDGTKANFSPQNILGRSEPYQIYSNTDARSITFDFSMHREMLGSDKIKEIESIVRLLEAAVYPNYGAPVAPQRVQVTVGKSIYISGIMTSESTKWYGPIGEDKKYNQVDVSFTVTEVTGQPKSFSDIRSMGGFRKSSAK